MTKEELKDDLQYIRGIIENNQRALIDNGVMFITNGIVVLFGLSITMLLGTMELSSFIPVLWIILVLLMVLANSILPQKIDPNLPQKTFASKILQANFVATGFPMFVMALFFWFANSMTLPALIAAFSALFGVMFFMFGAIINLNMMKALAFVWWAFMIISLSGNRIISSEQMGLAFAFLVGFLQLIPGIIIYRKWKSLYADKQV